VGKVVENDVVTQIHFDRGNESQVVSLFVPLILLLWAVLLVEDNLVAVVGQTSGCIDGRLVRLSTRWRYAEQVIGLA
jgi:hypothetical protein